LKSRIEIPREASLPWLDELAWAATRAAPGKGVGAGDFRAGFVLARMIADGGADVDRATFCAELRWSDSYAWTRLCVLEREGFLSVIVLDEKTIRCVLLHKGEARETPVQAGASVERAVEGALRRMMPAIVQQIRKEIGVRS
jgi:hypothetical protein